MMRADMRPTTWTRRALAGAVALALCILTSPRVGNAAPAPPYPPYPAYPSAPPPPRVRPAAGYAYPPPPVVAPPPPLSPVTRVVYAPFYVAGLIVRYGFYYAFVAPLEVFSRTVTYGESGGVDRRSRWGSEDR